MPPDSLFAPPKPPAPAPVAAEPVASPGPALYGRDEELAAVRALIARARSGRGGALAVVGGAGMGKTALLDAAVREAAPDFQTIGTRGIRGESRFALAGLHRLLRPVFSATAGLPAGEAAALAFLTGAGGPGPAADPFALCRAVLGLLAELGRSGPVLCWVDDTHHLDRPSLDALTFAARRLADEPVVLLFAGDDRGEDRLDCLADIPAMRLHPLDPDAALKVVRDHIPDVCGDPAAELVELAAGNPLALVELAAELTPEQLTGQAPPPAALPRDSRMRTHFRRRLDALGPGARTLVLLAVADDRLELDTLTRAAAEAGVDLAEWERAQRSGLVRVDGETVRVPDPLARTCLYADATLAERRAVHDLLARVLDRPWHRLRRAWHRAATVQGPDPELADELCAGAALAGAAGNHADAARAWRRAAALTPDPGVKADRLLAAAEDSWRAGRPHTARTLLRLARPLARTPELAGRADLLHGEIELRDGHPVAARRLLLEAAERLAAPRRNLALTALMRAAEAADLIGDSRANRQAAERAARLRHPAEPPVTELMLAHFSGMAAVVFDGRHVEARAALRRVVELGEAGTDPVAKTWAGSAAIALGEDQRAYELAAQAVHRARRPRSTSLLPWSLVILSLSECLLGRFHAALADSAEGLRLARAAGQENCAIDHLALMALVSAQLGDRDTTTAHLAEITEPVGVRGLSRPATVAAWALACLDLADDRPADAAARLRLRTATGAQHRVIRTLAIPHYVEAAVRCDQRRQATRALAAYEAWAEGTRSPNRLALANRCRALLADDDETAIRHFEEALRLHASADSAFEQARTALLYGHRLRRSRQPRAARDHLRNALQIFTEYGAERWAERARAELRAAGETVEPAAAPAGLDLLTPQQLQIARLVAEGATNREIAAQLTLSPRTIEHHLRNIFARLDIRSRVELTMLLTGGGALSR
ncbi:AAA family ATPase [Thermomonospora cellulosilytica]|uniref:DNA-binding NarL/FixJ family response regulator n=1 Tax=Thermomonospora cellulosilytica TaxID=1411118 RepID=A0A7W3R6R5_9ACTN|nr:LuxR family transcriptional regulator [Thermomonospora cellulosilytica]MBA9001724.1 DNA-binding NarL/FixJ family response regulator [Thermomonospora cellulosilytica]